jgi:hypothetical protein
MKLEVEQLELSTIVASLGKSRHYFEYVRKGQRTAKRNRDINILLREGSSPCEVSEMLEFL